MKSAFLISGIDWIFCSSAAFCSSVASSLMKTSMMTRFLRLVAPWLRLSRVTRTAPRMAVLMNTVITAAMAMTQLRRMEPNASREEEPQPHVSTSCASTSVTWS